MPLIGAAASSTCWHWLAGTKDSAVFSGTGFSLCGFSLGFGEETAQTEVLISRRRLLIGFGGFVVVVFVICFLWFVFLMTIYLFLWHFVFTHLQNPNKNHTD